MLEGDLNRRLKRSVSFVIGACAVIVALALMAVADGGGKLPGIGRAPILGLAGPPRHKAAPPAPHEPVKTPFASARPLPVASQSLVPTPVTVPQPVGPAPATRLVRIDKPAPVTPPAVTPTPVRKKPRPEPVPVTSPSAPPSGTPPKRQFGGPGIAGAHGSGRGLGRGASGTASGSGTTGSGGSSHNGKGNGTGDDRGKGKPVRGHGPTRRHEGGPHRGYEPCGSHGHSPVPVHVNRVQLAAVVPPERGRKVVRSSRSSAPPRHRCIRPSRRPRSR